LKKGTFESPESDHPKCQAKAGAHGWWSHARGQTTGDQNFDFNPRLFSLIHGKINISAKMKLSTFSGERRSEVHYINKYKSYMRVVWRSSVQFEPGGMGS